MLLDAVARDAAAACADRRVRPARVIPRRARDGERGIADRVELRRRALARRRCRRSTGRSTCSPSRRFPPRDGRSSSVASRSRRWPAACPWSRATRGPCPTSSAARASSCPSAMPPRSRTRWWRPPGLAARELRAAGLRPRAASARGKPWRATTSSSTRAPRHAASAPARDVEIIVVAYGAPDLLRAALEPVAGMPVTVVDNSSLPEIAALCAELGVRYIDSGANVGFGAAVNIALADRLDPGRRRAAAEPRRADRSRSDRRAAASRCAPRPTSPASGPCRPTSPAAPPGWSGRSRRRRTRGWRPSGWGDSQRGPRFVIGSVLLLRAEALAQVGGFDERFFLYAEETDWAYRAHPLGWRHAAVPGAAGRARRRRHKLRQRAARRPLLRVAGALSAQALRRRRLAGGPCGELGGSDGARDRSARRRRASRRGGGRRSTGWDPCVSRRA